MENTVEEKLSWIGKDERIETTNPGEKTKEIMKMIINSRRRDRFLNWLYGVLTIGGLLLLLHCLNVKIDSTMFIAAISGTGVLLTGSYWLKKIKDNQDP